MPKDENPGIDRNNAMTHHFGTLYGQGGENSEDEIIELPEDLAQKLQEASSHNGYSIGSNLDEEDTWVPPFQAPLPKKVVCRKPDPNAPRLLSETPAGIEPAFHETFLRKVRENPLPNVSNAGAEVFKSIFQGPTSDVDSSDELPSLGNIQDPGNKEEE